MREALCDGVHPALVSLGSRASCVDLTFGGGGHSSVLLERGVRVWAIDQDPEAVERGRQKFASEVQSGQLVLNHLRMSQAADRLRSENIQVGAVMADLGFSSDQIEDKDRGLSFRAEAPLDMRMDPTRERTARLFLELATEEEMADLFFEWGEESFGRRIARMLVHRREEHGEIPHTSKQLADWIAEVIPRKFSRTRHAATKTFQALRIWVNDELGELDSLLNTVLPLVVERGRVGIISFHSLEDRRVKHAFRALAGWNILTKKPLIPSDSEVESNPRSRSAKLRLIERDAAKGT